MIVTVCVTWLPVSFYDTEVAMRKAGNVMEGPEMSISLRFWFCYVREASIYKGTEILRLVGWASAGHLFLFPGTDLYENVLTNSLIRKRRQMTDFAIYNEAV